MKNGLGVRRRLALDIFSSIEDKRIAAHELRTIMWEATLRCNLACRHCGSDCRSEAAVPDMPAADFLRTIDTITPHVVPNRVLIVITGGEALMRRDIEEVGRALYDRGYPWGIVTNGMLLDERRLESLLRAGLHTATVSLDGFAETHNRIRRNERSYERALGALRLLARQPDILYDAVTCANADTLATLPRFRDFLIAEGVKRWRIFTIFPVGRGADDPSLQLDTEQFRRLMEFIRDTRREGRIAVNYGCEGFLGRYEGDVRDTFYHCSAGVSIAGIRVERRHLGMHEHSGPLRPGQHLPKRFHGRMEQPFRTIPRPRMDAARCVRELPRIQILPRQRDASARRNGTTARVPLQETVMTYGI